MSAEITEYLFTTNRYKKPYVLKDKDALATLLLRLLIMKPGTNLQHPEMGIDLIGRYRYSNFSDLYQLQSEINKQIEKYLPRYRGAEVTASKVKQDIKITINIDDQLFNFTTSKDSAKDEISLAKQEG